MKKLLCVVLASVLYAGVVFAQEPQVAGQAVEQAAQNPAEAQAVDPRAAAMSAMMAAEGIKRPGEVATPMGTLTLHGMVMTGLQGYMTDNTALDSHEEEWNLRQGMRFLRSNYAGIHIGNE